MPFQNEDVKRAYLRGYHRAYRKSAFSRAQLRQDDIPYNKATLREAFENGWRSGYSARRGEDRRDYQAQWYQQNRPRIVTRQRRQRRAARTHQAQAALVALSRVLA